MLERLVITQTVGLKLALIKSFRFKEWRALGDDFRTLLFCNPGETISEPERI